MNNEAATNVKLDVKEITFIPKDTVDLDALRRHREQYDPPNQGEHFVVVVEPNGGLANSV